MRCISFATHLCDQFLPPRFKEQVGKSTFQIAALESSDKVDEELEAMKAAMKKGDA